MYFSEHSFRPVAQGLIDSSMVEDITFHAWAFYGEGSVRLLNQILERKQNLHALAFRDCIFHAPLPQLLQALSSALRRPASPLRHFQFDDHHYSSLSNQSFSNLCQAVTESKLETFSIRVDHNQNRIQSLANTIPSTKIRELAIQFDHDGFQNRNHTMQTLHLGLKNNFTLQAVKYRRFDIPFDASDVDQTMKFYLQRNIRLAQWVENPATVPEHLWKEATTLAAKAGPNPRCSIAFCGKLDQKCCRWQSQEKAQWIVYRLTWKIDSMYYTL